jgi:hypothetical protein
MVSIQSYHLSGLFRITTTCLGLVVSVIFELIKVVSIEELSGLCCTTDLEILGW